MTEHWGRRYSYGVLAPISVPKLNKSMAPPTQMQKGHLHFGCGGDSIPRNIPMQQFYDVTTLRKSINRPHDSLQPAPHAMHHSLCQMKNKDIRQSALASHQSKFQLFPDWQRRFDDVSVVDDVSNNDVIDENEEGEIRLPPLEEPQRKSFFSRHSTISSFNQRNPSQTPALNTRCGRRPADWHLLVATHTVGR